MGKHTLSVSMELFALNRRRLCEALRPKTKKAVVLLQGGSNVNHYCSDVEYVFQQVSLSFFYIEKSYATEKSCLYALWILLCCMDLNARLQLKSNYRTLNF